MFVCGFTFVGFASVPVRFSVSDIEYLLGVPLFPPMAAAPARTADPHTPGSTCLPGRFPIHPVRPDLEHSDFKLNNHWCNTSLRI